jgi:hypothetical protein
MRNSCTTGPPQKIMRLEKGMVERERMRENGKRG